MKATKRLYRKPQLERVRLVAEEAVLNSCKFGYSAGHHGPRGQCKPDEQDPCVALGS